MAIARLLVLVGFVALTGLIVWAFMMGGGWDEVFAVTAMPWGLVTLADLYLGFLLIAVVIFAVEENKLIALAWTIPIFFLGNVWSALWFLLRGVQHFRN